MKAATCPRSRPWCRRDVLRTLAALTAVGCGSGTDEGDDGGMDTAAPVFDPTDPDWHAFQWDAYPDLAPPNGWTTVKEPSALLDILVAKLPNGALVALWRICSHGACPLVWNASTEQAQCECHGSRFDTEGQVLNGPATESIRTFPTAQTETAFWIYRPL